MRRIMIAAGLALSAALLTSGCQLVGGGSNDAKGTQSPGTRQAQPAATAGPQASGAPTVSKQVTIPIPGEQGETYTLGFGGLAVKGQLATLTLVWTPHGIGDGNISIFEMSAGDFTMIDSVNLKRYKIVHDSTGDELSPNINTAETGNNQPIAETYTFAAPPGNASMDIYLDNRRLFESVPVTR